MRTSAIQYAQVLMSVTEGKSGVELNKTVTDFVQVLAERHEMYRWREIVRAFDSVWKKEYGAANVIIETAHKVPEEVLQEFKNAVPNADVTSKVNPDLIGGAVVRIDDRRLDGSVKGQLERLELELS